jgi:hypothetical protein
MIGEEILESSTVIHYGLTAEGIVLDRGCGGAGGPLFVCSAHACPERSRREVIGC